MVVAKDVAVNDVKDWLNKHNVKIFEPETAIFFIEGMAGHISDGNLIINDDGSITQKLIYPLNDGQRVEVKYSPRYEIGSFYTNTKIVPANDPIGRTFAILATLSVEKLPAVVFQKFQREDYMVAASIAVFF